MISLFLIPFIIINIFYLIFNKFSKNSKKFNKKKMRVEESYLYIKYKINMKSINYKKFNLIIGITNSFIISVTIFIINYLKFNVYFKILLSILILIPLILILYSLIGNYYKKKTN